jgi:hypothetical protein
MRKYPCPCCGYLVFGEPPGSWEICPICFWEDDLSQLRFVDLAGGANRPSLLDAQRNVQAFGCCEQRVMSHVRSATSTDVRDPEWRIAAASDVEPRSPGTDYGATYPSDPTALYYWRTSFWRLGLPL